MKKQILIVAFSTIFMLLGHITFAHNDIKNRVQVELETGGFFGSKFESGLNFSIINAKVGYLINDKLFLGGGTGVGVRLLSLHGGNYTYSKIPVYLSAKYSFHLTSITSFILGADGGYNIFFKEDRDHKYTFLNTKAGFGFKVGERKKNSINIYAGYDVGTQEGETGIVGAFIGFSF